MSPARNLHKASPWRHDARVLATIDGPLSSSYEADFALQKKFNAKGNSPKMWTELWTGWYTHWGDKQAANRTAKDYGDGVKTMASDSNASFSLYMAHGGTSFGFWAGANILEGRFVADVTSYDYSAPISEDGTHQVGADGADGFDAVRRSSWYIGGAAATGLPGVRAVVFEDRRTCWRRTRWRPALIEAGGPRSQAHSARPPVFADHSDRPRRRPRPGPPHPPSRRRRGRAAPSIRRHAIEQASRRGRRDDSSSGAPTAATLRT